jgi:hypothetical protein
MWPFEPAILERVQQMSHNPKDIQNVFVQGEMLNNSEQGGAILADIEQ